MNKRGSQVEMVISFMIFITFLFFVFAAAKNPFGIKNDKEGLLEYVDLQIQELASADLETVTINLLTPTVQNCIELDDAILDLNINSGFSKGSTGLNYNIYISSSDPNDLRIMRTGISDNFIKIYSSPVFESLQINSDACQILIPDVNYEIGFTKTQRYIFQDEVLSLISQYPSSYETLKTNLKIPKGTNFGYGLKLANGTIFETHGEEDSSNSIYISENPVFYVDDKGNILAGYLRAKIW